MAQNWLLSWTLYLFPPGAPGAVLPFLQLLLVPEIAAAIRFDPAPAC